MGGLFCNIAISHSRDCLRKIPKYGHGKLKIDEKGFHYFVEEKWRITMSSPALSSPASLSTPLLIALVTLKGYEEYKTGKQLYVEDLSKYLVVLEKEGIDISRISLSRNLDTYWSEDIAQFVSEGLVFGFLRQKSPLEFTERCFEVCKNAIETRLSSRKELLPFIREAGKILQLESLPVFCNV